MCAVARQMKDLALSRSSVYQTITENIHPATTRWDVQPSIRVKFSSEECTDQFEIRTSPPSPLARRGGNFTHRTVPGVGQLTPPLEGWEIWFASRIQVARVCPTSFPGSLAVGLVSEFWIRYINPPRCWGVMKPRLHMTCNFQCDFSCYFAYKTCLTLPTRMLFSGSISWIGKKIITY